MPSAESHPAIDVVRLKIVVGVADILCVRAQMLAVSLVVLTSLVGCAVGADAQGDDEAPPVDTREPQQSLPEPSAVAVSSPELAATESELAAEPVTQAQPEPQADPKAVELVAAEPVCRFALDLVSSEASYNGFTATMSWDASAGRYSNQLDALDLATVAWAVVETWKNSSSFAADRATDVRARLGHVSGVVADQETINHALGVRQGPSGFSSDELATCVHASHAYMVADRAATNPYPHAHELTHALAAAVFGDLDAQHKHSELWGAEGLAVHATKLFRELNLSRTEPRVSPR